MWKQNEFFKIVIYKCYIVFLEYCSVHSHQSLQICILRWTVLLILKNNNLSFIICDYDI